MKLKLSKLSLLLLSAFLFGAATKAFSNDKGTIICVASFENDLAKLLRDEGYNLRHAADNFSALYLAPQGSTVLLLSDMAKKPSILSPEDMALIAKKKLHVYADFACIKGNEEPKVRTVGVERVCVTEPMGSLKPMDLLSVNQARFVQTQPVRPKLVLARVAGFDNAVFGLEGTETFPLVDCPQPNLYLSTACLSDFSKLRLMPEHRWQAFWEALLSELTGTGVKFDKWPMLVWPAYGKNDALPDSAAIHAIRKGVDWFWKGHFFVHPSWRDDYLMKYQNVYLPKGPALPQTAADGDGSMGIMEGHYSAVDADGRQDYRYWLRADVHGEAAMALTLAGKLLGQKKYIETAHRLIDYSLPEATEVYRSDPNSPCYGLLCWGFFGSTKDTHYGDDNARYLLGALLAAHLMGEHRWDTKLRAAIDGNLRLTGLDGFQGDRHEGRDIVKNGIEHYHNRHFVNPHPHYESWLWAVYLWQYSLTGEPAFLETAKKGISATMAAYPKDWKWTNGIQQEKARMVLPLAWLYRVEPTKEHRDWLDTIVNDLKSNQMECGAIREELGDPTKGDFAGPKSNADYGRGEAPLIFHNGDPVADMLYTSNFAFFGLNEAARATGDPAIRKMTDKLGDFLVRIQACSDEQQDVDGAWYRAFNYRDWNWWASNSDAGWGSMSTLTGWIQSWIVGTLAMKQMNTSYWELTHQKKR